MDSIWFTRDGTRLGSDTFSLHGKLRKGKKKKEMPRGIIFRSAVYLFPTFILDKDPNEYKPLGFGKYFLTSCLHAKCKAGRKVREGLVKWSAHLVAYWDQLVMNRFLGPSLDIGSHTLGKALEMLFLISD